MNDKTTSAALSFVSGFADTVGFLGLGGVFVAHVTGNFVLAGASLVRLTNDGVIVKLATFPVFALAVAATYFASCALAARGRDALRWLIFAEAFFLLVFLLLGVSFATSIAAHSEIAIALTASAGVVAMAIQNAFMKLHLPKLTMTTVMTGNVTQFAIDAAKLLSGREDADDIRPRMKSVGIVLLSFLLGAASGAGLYAFVGFHSLWLAVAIITIVGVGRRS